MGQGNSSQPKMPKPKARILKLLQLPSKICCKNIVIVALFKQKIIIITNEFNVI